MALHPDIKKDQPITLILTASFILNSVCVKLWFITPRQALLPNQAPFCKFFLNKQNLTIAVMTAS